MILGVHSRRIIAQSLVKMLPISIIRVESLIITTDDPIPPHRVHLVLGNGMDNAFFEAKRGLPAELLANLRRINCIASVVARVILELPPIS